MTLHTQMEVSLLSRGSDLAPLCHSNYRNRARGQIRTQLNSTNLALAMLLSLRDYLLLPLLFSLLSLLIGKLPLSWETLYSVTPIIPSFKAPCNTHGDDP